MKSILVGPDPAAATIPANRMNVGDYGVVVDFTDKFYHGHVVLRTYDRIVSITAPNCSWHCIELCKLPVRLLQKGESFITKIVED